MAKNIIVSLDGEESSFGFKAVDRASLYGKRRRIALDKDGNILAQGIDPRHIVATLTAALQELNAKFDAYVASHP